MAPSARQIAEGDLYTPSDINNLFKDIHDPAAGHPHDGVDGVKVRFGDLDVVGSAGETRPGGGGSSYAEIDAHVAATAGIHGLPATAHALGSNKGSGYLVDFGYQSLVDSGTGEYYLAADVTFNATFTSTPACVQVTVAGTDATCAGVSVSDLTTTRMHVQINAQVASNKAHTITGFWWLVIGK